MKKSSVVIALGVGALLLAWALVVVRDSGEEPAPAPAPEATPEEAAAPPSAPPGVKEEPPAIAVAATPPAAAPPAEEDDAIDPRPHQPRPAKMGPVDALKTAYESDMRDHEAGDAEERIRAQLKQANTPAQLLRRVSCVKTVCKLELRWTPGDAEAYMTAMMSLVSHVSQKIAAAPVGEDEGQEVYPVDVYVSRLEPAYLPAGSN